MEDRAEVSQSASPVPLPERGDRVNPSDPPKSERDGGLRTIAITASFTAEPIAEPMKFLLDEVGMDYRVEFAPYQQVFQELLDGSSLLRSADGVGVILARLEDWLHLDPSHGIPSNAKETLERVTGEIITAVDAARQESTSTFVVCFCPASRRLSSEGGWKEWLQGLEAKVASAFENRGSVHVVRSAEILELYPVADHEDEYANRLGNIPYTTDFFSALASMVVRRIWGITANKYKVIALDCDNTLWKGICGEEAVVVDEPRRALQQVMIAQRDAGMLLCLCSKNNEPDVWDVFGSNPQMLLKRKDFAACRINWSSKSENLRALAKELGLGLDSVIFLDDSPVECAEVEAGSPEVLTLLLPEDAAEIPTWLKHVWAFDHVKSTAEDARRTELYRENTQRESLRQQSYSLEEFLASLQIEIKINAMAAEDAARVAQLTQRTNQFNTTTIRRSEAELQHFLNSPGAACSVVRVRDRFGDYGLVGAMLFTVGGGILTVESMMLSCRALGRRVEHAMLAHLAEVASERRMDRIDLLYRPSERNAPVREFLESIAADFKAPQGDGSVYRVPRGVAANAGQALAATAKGKE